MSAAGVDALSCPHCAGVHGTGRQDRLKIDWVKARAGSSPAPGMLLALLLASSVAVPAALAAATEQTVKARLLDVDRAHLRLRADVAGKATLYAVARESLLRGFRRGDLVLLRLRGRTVVDVRLAVVTAQVLSSDDQGALLRVGGREERFLLARKALRRQLRRGDFVRLEIEERGRGRRVITRVY
jgi:hypothetical protein